MSESWKGWAKLCNVDMISASESIAPRNQEQHLRWSMLLFEICTVKSAHAFDFDVLPTLHLCNCKLGTTPAFFGGRCNLSCAAIGSVVIICWYMIVYRRDSTSRQFTHRCTVRIMCLSDIVHTARLPFHCIFRSPSAFSIKDAIMLAWFWGWFWLIHGICTQWYWTAKLTFLIYIDANPVFQDIVLCFLFVCKWQLRPTVCLLAQPYIWKTRGWCFFLQLYLSYKYPHGCPTRGTVRQGLIWGQVLGNSILPYPSHILWVVPLYLQPEASC